ncbi:hypothetical protein P153DRAFT_389349 [Dothidotthia symphoricarpi CBS 119687]|uniref:Uncharacterized protein n=1 Tax=Dothidotthia symphoricarpi CBS 119687 TaxID=1392245 RepID=A0A6A6A1M3_9PLEO|nr:uncharacterized protein P153DRAFT_389349 [Dothidotthia symphoricarpi CBS 119687]KAF2125902.1 hypothetical protein P153DRAFT_389349 [Dothidotthia symphoricarpi CBS 119687]
MVLYDEKGRVIKAHEEYLEQLAKKHADYIDCLYLDQIAVCNAHDADAGAQKTQCFITIQPQKFGRLYTRYGHVKEDIKHFRTKTPITIPDEGLDRRTLMRCSTTADEFFRYNPTATQLCLPVRYPRLHLHSVYHGKKGLSEFTRDYPEQIEPGKKYVHQYDSQVSFLRADEITAYVIPWLRAMQKVLDNKIDKNINIRPENLPIITPPDSLLEKIHLYNASLHLGLPSFVQKPLTTALIAQMHKTKLRACHLETLEITIARFYARGIPALDPVLAAFIAAYAARPASDRANPESAEAERKRGLIPRHKHKSGYYYYPAGLKRELLTYTSFEPGRADWPGDTALVPPELAVLGGAVRRWAGVRRDGGVVRGRVRDLFGGMGLLGGGGGGGDDGGSASEETSMALVDGDGENEEL